MAQEIERRPSNDIVMDAVGIYRVWNNFENSRSPKDRQEVIDLAPSTYGSLLPRADRYQIRNFFLNLKERLRYSSFPQDEKEYLMAKFTASADYLDVLTEVRLDFYYYIEHTLGLKPKEFRAKEIGDLKENISERLKGFGYLEPYEVSIKKFRHDHRLEREEILTGIESCAKKSIINIKNYLEVEDLELDYALVERSETTPWKAWLRKNGGDFKLEVYPLTSEGYVRGEEERIGLHEIGLHAFQMASWEKSSEKGIITPASCLTTLHTPEQISTEGLATSLPIIAESHFPLSPYGQLALRVDYLERIVLHNAHMRVNLLPPEARWTVVINDVLDHLPYMTYADVNKRLRLRYANPIDRAYELSYSEGARLHFQLYEFLANDQLFALLVKEEFKRPMTAEQIQDFAKSLKATDIHDNPNLFTVSQ